MTREPKTDRTWEHWQPEQIDDLIYFRTGQHPATFRHAASRIGKTRNSCIGKWRRLKEAGLVKYDAVMGAWRDNR